MERGQRWSVLDHGSITLVDWMGDDQAIVDAARVSYGEGTKHTSSPAQLIDYLIRHRHTSPIEHGEIVLQVECPILLARQWFRHRTASPNEVSGRFSELPETVWIPGPDDWRYQNTTGNRQGSGGAHELHDVIGGEVRDATHRAFEAYRWMLDNDVAREQARGVLPLATYTRFRWKQDLHNLLHLVRLRTDAHAQPEIQAYARVISEIIAGLFPLVWSSWTNHVRDAVTFSADEWEALQGFIGSGIRRLTVENFTGSRRAELAAKLGVTL